MMRTLAAELREELAARRAGLQAGSRWRAAACAAAACIALAVLL